MAFRLCFRPFVLGMKAIILGRLTLSLPSVLGSKIIRAPSVSRIRSLTPIVRKQDLLRAIWIPG